MTLRARTRPVSRRTRLRRFLQGEERQQALVTALFVVVILAVVLILVGAVGLAWYNDNLRPLGRVGSVEIGPQLYRDRLELELWRIERERNRLTRGAIDGEIDEATHAARESELGSRSQALQATGLEDLMDLIYQSQLAGPEGVTVTDADVDARLADEFNGVERRRVLAIFVEPGADKPEGEAPSSVDRLAALDRVQEAKAQLDAGRPWADVAREFSTDPSGQNGGDYGVISEMAVVDPDWGEQLFELPVGGTTEIVAGQDGIYRIGRVTEIIDPGEEPGLKAELNEDVSDQSLRDLLRYEATAEALRDKIATAAVAQTPEQARISLIEIQGLGSGDPEEAEGEVDYSEIVYAPNDELIDAPELPADDPAWETARVEAQAAYDELAAIAAGEDRVARFEELASEVSDSPSREDGGAVGYITRGLAPEAIASVLFDQTHEPGALLGPVRSDAGWYVLLFHDRRDSPEQRLQKIQAALAEPNADFAAIAREYSDGAEAEDGGVIGWVTKEQLTAFATEISDAVFAMSPGQVTQPIELEEQETTYIVKLEEKGPRPLDPNQLPQIRAAAFDEWYEPKKTQAIADGIIIGAAPPPTDEELEPEV